MEDLGDSCCVRHLKYDIRLTIYTKEEGKGIEVEKKAKNVANGGKGDRNKGRDGNEDSQEGKNRERNGRREKEKEDSRRKTGFYLSAPGYRRIRFNDKIK